MEAWGADWEVGILPFGTPNSNTSFYEKSLFCRRDIGHNITSPNIFSVAVGSRTVSWTGRVWSLSAPDLLCSSVHGDRQTLDALLSRTSSLFITSIVSSTPSTTDIDKLVLHLFGRSWMPAMRLVHQIVVERSEHQIVVERSEHQINCSREVSAPDCSQEGQCTRL